MKIDLKIISSMIIFCLVVLLIIMSCSCNISTSDTTSIVTNSNINIENSEIESTVDKISQPQQITTESQANSEEQSTVSHIDNIIKDIKITSDDAKRLQKISIAEAGGESVETMAIVMLVVLNRVENDKFPNTIKKVIYQSGQFTPVASGAYSAAKPNEKSQQALDLILSGWDESQGALYFESKGGWNRDNITFLFKKDGMNFYK